MNLEIAFKLRQRGLQVNGRSGLELESADKWIAIFSGNDDVKFSGNTPQKSIGESIESPIAGGKSFRIMVR